MYRYVDPVDDSFLKNDETYQRIILQNDTKLMHSTIISWLLEQNEEI
jgi:hypothetical protein